MEIEKLVRDDVVGAWMVAASVLMAAAPLGAQEPAPPGAWPEFVRAFDAYVEAGGIVGASALVMRDGVVTARRDVGFADRDAGRAVDGRTIFHYGSITKTLTAIAGHAAPRARAPVARRPRHPLGPGAPSSPATPTDRRTRSRSDGGLPLPSLQNPTWPWDEGRALWEPFEATDGEQLVAVVPYQRLPVRARIALFVLEPRLHLPGPRHREDQRRSVGGLRTKNIFAPLGITQSYFGNTSWHLAEYRSHNYELHADGGRLVASDEGGDFDPRDHDSQRRLERAARRRGPVPGVPHRSRAGRGDGTPLGSRPVAGDPRGDVGARHGGRRGRDGHRGERRRPLVLPRSAFRPPRGRSHRQSGELPRIPGVRSRAQDPVAIVVDTFDRGRAQNPGERELVELLEAAGRLLD